jgi:iron(III) transport system substrate-binding protein
MDLMLAPRLVLASIATLVSFAEPALAEDFDPQLVARARQEGKLVFYTGFSGNELYRAIKKGFEDRFGVTVDMLIARPSETHERLRVEVASGRTVADALIHGESTSTRLVRDGLLQKVGDIPGAARLAVEASAPGYSIPGYMSGYSLMVNSSLVKPEDEPKSWFDLLEPRWTGKMLADDPRASGSGHVLFSVTVEKFGVDFQKKLASQKPVFGRDLGVDQMRIARGEYPLRYPQSLANMRDLRGLPLRFVIPKEGLVYVRADIGIVTGTTRPNAARLFLDYMLAPSTQAMLAGFGLIPVTTDEVEVPDAQTRELVGRARRSLMGTSHADTAEAMLELARDVYK